MQHRVSESFVEPEHWKDWGVQDILDRVLEPMLRSVRRGAGDPSRRVILRLSAYELSELQEMMLEHDASELELGKET